MCVLETITHWGEVIGSEIVWAETEPSKSLRVWLPDNPKDCHTIDPSNMPYNVDVRTASIGHDNLLQILQREGEILKRAASQTEGPAYTADNWRLGSISPAP